MMSDGFLTFEHGIVTLGGKEVPGILRSMSINGAVRFDEAEMDSGYGKKKTAMGWDDAAVSLEMILPTDEDSTCYEKLADLDSIFKGHNNGGFPNVYDVVNPHLISRNVHQVVFSELESAESDSDDTITASMKFVEHEPPVQKVEKQGAANGSKPAAKSGDPEPDEKVTEEEPNPFVQGFLDGSGQS